MSDWANMESTLTPPPQGKDILSQFMNSIHNEIINDILFAKNGLDTDVKCQSQGQSQCQTMRSNFGSKVTTRSHGAKRRFETSNIVKKRKASSSEQDIGTQRAAEFRSISNEYRYRTQTLSDVATSTGSDVVASENDDRNDVENRLLQHFYFQAFYNLQKSSLVL